MLSVCAWDLFLGRRRAGDVLLLLFYITDFLLVSSYDPGMIYIQEIHKENTAKITQKTFG